MYKFPFDSVSSLRYNANSAAAPAVHRGAFKLSQVGDAFLDMRGWGKGIVFVNGRNLGRYWSIGPQQTLYLPGVWLKKGRNEIDVFELLKDDAHSVFGLSAPILDQLEK
jgi:beta-galactosidase